MDVKEREKFACFGRKGRPSFSSDNRYCIDFITPVVLIDWQK
jgi:hypothetical protein